MNKTWTLIIQNNRGDPDDLAVHTLEAQHLIDAENQAYAYIAEHIMLNGVAPVWHMLKGVWRRSDKDIHRLDVCAEPVPQKERLWL